MLTEQNIVTGVVKSEDYWGMFYNYLSWFPMKTEDTEHSLELEFSGELLKYSF